MDELNFIELIDSLELTALGDVFDTMDKSGTLRKMAECLYMHKMPVKEIFPFITDYGKILRGDKHDKS